MPGFMGVRPVRNPTERLDLRREEQEKARREAARGQEQERRALEKVQEILQNQEEAQVDSDCRSDTQLRYRAMSMEELYQLQVGQIMSCRVAVISYDDTLLTVQGIFSSVRFRHLPVVDGQGNIIGLISDRDLYREVSPFLGTVNEQSRDRELMNRKVGTIMTRNPLCVYPDDLVQDAVHLMHRHLISCLPVLKKATNKIEGIITWKDVVRAFCPDAFLPGSDTTIRRQGVAVNPEASESARLRARAATERQSQSQRLTPRTESQRMVAPKSESQRLREAPSKPASGHATDAFPKVKNIDLPVMDDI